MKIDVAEQAWTENPRIAAHWPTPDRWCFAIAGRSEVIQVEVLNGKLLLFPERSAQHKALAAALATAVE